MPNRLDELTALRTEYTKHFATDEPGTFSADISGAPLHYRTPAGDWDDIANLVQTVAGGWMASTNEVSWGIQNGYLSITAKGRTLTMRPSRIIMVDRTDPMNRNRKLADAVYTNVTRDGDKITVHDVFPQTDLVVDIGSHQLTKTFVVRQKPAIPDPVSLGWDPAQTYIVFDWTVNLPSGAVVTDTVTGERVGPGFYAGQNALVVGSATDPVLYFAAPHGVAANGHRFPVWYISKVPEVTFGEAISYHSSQVAPYPISIDPTSNLSAVAGTVGYVEGGYATYTPGYVMVGGSNDGKGGYWTWRGFFTFDLSSITTQYTIDHATWHYHTADEYMNWYAAAYDVGDYGGISNDDWNRSLGSQVGYQPAFNNTQWNQWFTYSWDTWLGAISNRRGQKLGIEFRNDTTLQYFDIYADSYLELTYHLTLVPDGSGPTLDAFIVKTQAGTPITANAVIKKAVTSWFTAKAILRKVQGSTFTADATRFATIIPIAPPTADAYFMVGGAVSSFPVDAVILGTSSGTFTSNAVRKTTILGTTTADAAIRKFGVAGSFAADAILRTTVNFAGTIIGKDSFTGSDGSALSSHIPDYGYSWNAGGNELIYGNQLRARGGTSGVDLPDTQRQAGDVDLYTTVDFNLTSHINQFGVGVFARGNFVSTINDYMARVRYDGYWEIARHTANSYVTIASGTASGIGTYTRIRFRVSGSSPTLLKVKFWDSTQPEPSGWTAQTSDNTAGNQMATGLFGLALPTYGSAYSVYVDNWLATTDGQPGVAVDGVLLKTISGVPQRFTADAWKLGGAVATFTANAIIKATITVTKQTLSFSPGSVTAERGRVRSTNAVLATALAGDSPDILSSIGNPGIEYNGGQYGVRQDYNSWNTTSLAGKAINAARIELAGPYFWVGAPANPPWLLLYDRTFYPADAGDFISQATLQGLTWAAAIRVVQAGTSGVSVQYSIPASVIRTNERTQLFLVTSDNLDGTAPGSTERLTKYDGSPTLYVDIGLMADARIAGGITANAWVAQSNTGSFTANAVIKGQVSSSFTANAVIPGAGVSAFGADAVVRRTITGSLSSDAVKLRTNVGPVSLTTDAIVRRVQSGSFAGSAVLKGIQTGSTYVNAVTKKTILPTPFPGDSVLRGTVQSTFSANAVLLVVRTVTTLSVAAVVKRVTTSSLSMDATVRRTIAGTSPVDAVRRATIAGSFTANASIPGAGVGSFAADAVVRRSASGILLANAVLRRTFTGSLTGDALKRKTSTGTLGADAVLRATRTAGFTASSAVSSTRISSLPADACLVLGATVSSLSADATLQATRQASFPASAITLVHRTSTFTVDSRFARTTVGAITVNASISGAGVSGFTASAVIQVPGLGALHADASISPLILREVETTLTARTLSWSGDETRVLESAMSARTLSWVPVHLTIRRFTVNAEIA